MTCIVGIEHEGGVTIGADSASSNGYSIDVNANRKLFRTGEFLVGFTSSWRMGQLLQYAMHPPSLDTWDVDRFMATTFVDRVRDTLKAGGFATLEKSAESGGTFLVGVAGRLYSVYDDYQVAHTTRGYAATGSGQAFAMGCLYQTRAYPAHTVEQRCRAALSAAAELNPHVRPPFHIDTLETAS